MSIHIIKLIPTEVGFLPQNITESDVEAAIAATGITYAKLEIKTLDSITFIDCGDNLEYVRCPYCHHEAIKWWANVMTQAGQTGFKNRNIITPCCQRLVMLEDMDYCLPMGFAKYVIEIIEATDIITSGDVDEISDSLGCPFKKITARY